MQNPSGAALAVIAALVGGPARADDAFTTLGDALRVALPLAAGICAYRQDRLASYATGFLGQVAVTQGLKYGLGDAGINERPNGESHGFPSAHTADAFSGAADLSLHCAPGNPLVAAGTGAAAVLVGASRLDADEHDLLQVVAGAVLGYFSTGVMVTPSPAGGFGLSYQLNF